MDTADSFFFSGGSESFCQAQMSCLIISVTTLTFNHWLVADSSIAHYSGLTPNSNLLPNPPSPLLYRFFLFICLILPVVKKKKDTFSIYLYLSIIVGLLVLKLQH